MEKSIFLDKYPIYTLRVSKDETPVKSVDEIIESFRKKIDEHPVATFISVFDNYAHTKSLGGKIMDGLKNAKNLIFCFGAAIPNIKILAARPRCIGICETEDAFIIEFIEAPKEEHHKTMEDWSKAVVS
jgi:hypothetical protein